MWQSILGPLFADTYTSCCRDIQLVCGESQPCSMQFLVSSCVFIFCNLNGSAEIYSDCLETKGVIYTSWKHNLIQDGCESVARGWLLGTCKLPVSLTLGGSFNQRLERVNLPSNLQSLTFGNVFDQSLEGVNLPSNLQSLTFGWHFNQSL